MLKSLKQASRMIFPEEAAEKDRELEAEAAAKLAAEAKHALPEPESQPAKDAKPPAKPA
jgi:hypothetical protein